MVLQVKEDVCFVSTAFESELTKCYQMKGQMIVPISYAHRIPSVDQNPTTTTTSQAAESMEIQDHQSNGIDQGCQPHGDDEDEDEEEEEEDVEYLRKFFVMPDFHRIMKGYVKQEGEAFAPDEQVTIIPSCYSPPHVQVLTMESERFSIPEVLFRPTDIGMNQAGIVETIGQVVNSLHEVLVFLSSSSLFVVMFSLLLP